MPICSVCRDEGNQASIGIFILAGTVIHAHLECADRAQIYAIDETATEGNDDSTLIEHE